MWADCNSVMEYMHRDANAPYEIHAGMIGSGDHMNMANASYNWEALLMLDFLFEANLWHSPTSGAADILLPVCHWTEMNAQRIAQELGVSFREVSIEKPVRQHFLDIGQEETSLDVTFENSQARERTQVLMDVANQCGGLVVGTGDLSELALGWATYNGDHMSMYGVNAGVPKTLVRHLVQYEADIAASAELRRVLLDILDTPVSPELLPARDGEISQKTEDLVGPYELHDFYLYYVLRFGFGPSKIFRLAKAAFAGRAEYPDEVLYKLSLIHISEPTRPY